MSVRTIGVVGAGKMGTGTVQVAAAAGFLVALVDVDETALSTALERIGSGYGRLVAKGQMSPEAKQAAIRLIETGTGYSVLAPADLVVEAATENAEIKEKILQAVDKVVRVATIISTNTSSVSITRLGACVSNPGRFIGLHFFNPVPLICRSSGARCRRNIVPSSHGSRTSSVSSFLSCTWMRRAPSRPCRNSLPPPRIAGSCWRVCTASEGSGSPRSPTNKTVGLPAWKCCSHHLQRVPSAAKASSWRGEAVPHRSTTVASLPFGARR